jgi:hypothetical protein
MIFLFALRTLTKCLESNANPDFDIIVPISLNVTTNAPILLESPLVEDYPDYVDFSEGQYVDMERVSTLMLGGCEVVQISCKWRRTTFSKRQRFRRRLSL